MALSLSLESLHWGNRVVCLTVFEQSLTKGWLSLGVRYCLSGTVVAMHCATVSVNPDKRRSTAST